MSKVEERKVAELYDAVIHRPEGVDRDELLRKAKSEIGLDDSRAKTLVDNLMSAGAVRVKGNVPNFLATDITGRFARAGFPGEVVRHEQEASIEAAIVCPACEARIAPGEEQICPSCGYDLKSEDSSRPERRNPEGKDWRRKARRRDDLPPSDPAESASRAKQLEQRIRTQIERQYAIKNGKGLFFLRHRAWLMPVALLGMGLAFVTGYLSGNPQFRAMLGLEAVAPVSKAQSGVDPVLVERFLKSTGDSLPARLAAGPAQAANPSDDAFENPPSLDSSANAAKNGANPKGVLAEGDRLRIMQEFALFLAESGQIARAREVLARMQIVTGGKVDLETAMLLRRTRVRIDAWNLALQSGERNREAMDALGAAIKEIPMPAGQAEELAEAGAILSANGVLARESALLFSDAVKVLKDEKDLKLRAAAGRNLLLARAKGLSLSIKRSVERGTWKEVQTLVTELGTLAGEVTDWELAARVYGYQYQSLRTLGRADEAKSALAAALSNADKLADVESRLALKCSLAALPDGLNQDALLAAMDRDYRFLEKSPVEVQASGLVVMGLFYASVGKTTEAQEVAARLGSVAKMQGGSAMRRANQQRLLAPLAQARYLRDTAQWPAMESQLQAAAKLIL